MPDHRCRNGFLGRVSTFRRRMLYTVLTKTLIMEGVEQYTKGSYNRGGGSSGISGHRQLLPCLGVHALALYCGLGIRKNQRK